MTAPSRRILVMHLGRRGGGPQFTLELARALRAMSVPCAALVSARNVYLPDFQALEIPLFVEASRRFTPATPFALRRSLRRCLRAWGPAEVWCGMGHPLDLMVLDMIKRANLPFRLVVHDGVPHLGDPYSWLKRANDFEQRSATTLVTLSAHVADSIRLQWPDKPQVQLWLPPFTPRQPPGPAVAPGAREAPLKLLFFGRIIKYKGLGLLLDAAELLRADNVPFVLTIAGDGLIPEKEAEQVTALGATLVNRFVSEEEAAGYFQACDVVVLPYIEASQSGVVATALGHGKPVVATPIGGLGDQVREQGAGIVIPEMTAASLAAALTRLSRDRGFLAETTSRTFDPALRNKCGWAEWVAQLLRSTPRPSESA